MNARWIEVDDPCSGSEAGSEGDSSDTEEEEVEVEDSDGFLESSCWLKRIFCRQSHLETRLGYRLRRDGHIARIYAPQTYVVRPAPTKELSYLVVPGFLSLGDIEKVHAAGQQPSVVKCEDRSNDLEYMHVAYRFEKELRAMFHDLYYQLLGVMAWADMCLWGALKKQCRVYPEVEYIRYDGRPTDRKYSISPHVDNLSVVTLVCLLSDPRGFSGGISGFDPPASDDAARYETPTLGSAIIFRGEELSHWVTPVVAGTRYVLQIEMSRE